MSTFAFVAPDELKSVMRAAGAVAPSEAPHCPFQVGDVIAYPGPIGLALRVVSRSFFPADEKRPARWYLWVEQAEHPLAA
jgi:hypothetical protein